ncbi:extracellular solute-binding protein [Paenibacillus pasadenensis]|uniref:ABC transporter, solute-binding protein n=1 Tax=Paenibacillus pasadenensis TaxID=217090 RepID=A0A2N5NB23_9BACL|nr:MULTISPECIES: extracellular solute-binding protein [Paenibacillus]PLT47546.1 ABC transporter, solute-binding protein [Paenibacillus pasadenensis]QGG57777.1 extracellular solute-binding protein [Paenibacillus sp. B01]
MNKNRFGKTALASLAAMALLSACGNGAEENGGASTNDSGAGGGKVKLTLWHNFAGDDARAKTVRAKIDEFAAAHPEIELDAQAIPVDGYRQRLSTVAAADEMPDVFLSYAGSHIKGFQESGLVQPIQELLDAKPEWKDSFLPGAFDGSTFDGATYTAPLAMSATSFLYYNAELFQQHNVAVPKTWDELMAAVDTFNKAGITPIALGNKAPWVAQSTILGSLADRVTGTDWFKKAVAQDGAAFTDAPFVEALGYFKQLVDADAFDKGANTIDNTQAEQVFIQGKAAMMVSGAWTLTNLATTPEDTLKKIEVTVLPAIAGGKGDANTISGGPGAGFALSKKVEGDRKQAAFDLIYAISGPDAQKAIAESNSMVMYKTDVDSSKVTSLYYKAFELVKTVGITPVYDAYLSAEAGEAINNGLQEIMMGAAPDAVAKNLQDAQARSLNP